MSYKLLGGANQSPIGGFEALRGESVVRLRWNVATKRKDCMGA